MNLIGAVTRVLQGTIQEPYRCFTGALQVIAGVDVIENLQTMCHLVSLVYRKY